MATGKDTTQDELSASETDEEDEQEIYTKKPAKRPALQIQIDQEAQAAKLRAEHSSMIEQRKAILLKEQQTTTPKSSNLSNPTSTNNTATKSTNSQLNPTSTNYAARKSTNSQLSQLNPTFTNNATNNAARKSTNSKLNPTSLNFGATKSTNSQLNPTSTNYAARKSTNSQLSQLNPTFTNNTATKSTHSQLSLFNPTSTNYTATNSTNSQLNPTSTNNAARKSTNSKLNPTSLNFGATMSTNSQLNLTSPNNAAMTTNLHLSASFASDTEQHDEAFATTVTSTAFAAFNSDQTAGSTTAADPVTDIANSAANDFSFNYTPSRTGRELQSSTPMDRSHPDQDYFKQLRDYMDERLDRIEALLQQELGGRNKKKPVVSFYQMS
jgi:hypothetical protein